MAFVSVCAFSTVLFSLCASVCSWKFGVLLCLCVFVCVCVCVCVCVLV